MNIGERIKLLRTEKGLTLEEVAIRVGTTKQTIQRYESGEISNIPSDKIEKLAMVYDTSPVKIMGWDSEIIDIKEAKYISEERKQVIDRIALLSENDFRYIAELVDRLVK